MSSAPDPPASLLRVAHQLRQLSELVEGLTWRMMELEERLAGMEALLHTAVNPPAHGGQAAGGGGPTVMDKGLSGEGGAS
mgnify:CR=1 FL=1